MRDRVPSGARPAFLVAVSATLVPLAVHPSASEVGVPRAVAYPTRTMGTYANVTIVTADSVAAIPAARRAHRAFSRVDSLMSNWTQTSEVARINAHAGRETLTVHPEVAEVVGRALEIGDASLGAFDITVEPLVRLWGFLGGTPHVPDPTDIAGAIARTGLHHVVFDRDDATIAFALPDLRIDLGGIAKGYGVDAAAHALATAGVADALVDISGNMLAMGHPPGRDAWAIGVRDPRDVDPYVATLKLTGMAVATSGAYEQFVTKDGERYGHILDPRTGWPSEGVISVTVVAEAAMDADAWGTALFALGPDRARARALERDDIAAVLIVPGAGVDTVYVEDALAEDFVLEPGCAGRFHVVVFP
jgi:thiamine biosynthesis lipoprotein